MENKLMRQLTALTNQKWMTTLGLAGSLVAVAGIAVVTGIVLRALLTHNAPFGEANDEILASAPVLPETDSAVISEEEASDRVTILLMGADTRPSETGYRTPTDTIMLLSVDRNAKTVGLISIPRDLYVDIPGYGFDRINTAYVRGGGQLAMQTVANTMGVPVDHYLLVQFDAFTTLVDEIGGIDIYVPTEIYDPEFPAECYSREDCGFDPLYIPAGQQHMDGITALKYARVRHIDTDFERSRRQQAVLMAVRDRIVSLEMAPRLLQRAPALYNTLTDSFRTDMSLEAMLQLAQLANEIDSENIHAAVIDSNYVTSITAPNGAAVLEPMSADIGALVRETFGLDATE